MPASFTPATPRYRIEGVKGEYYDVFSKRANAIKAAVKMAAEYPGTTFLVVKKVNLKDKVIFRFKIETEFKFDDLQDVLRGIVEVYQEKLDKTAYWRKPDDS
jgi:ATP-dependent Clp protease ATP-binding subunit ClpA